MTIANIDEYRPAPVTVANPWIELMQPAAELANQIAATGFVPKTFQNRPAEITAAILFGAELGIGPMQSLAKIDIVEGRPAPRAELGRALAMAAGHEVWVEESTNTRVTVTGRRRGSQRTSSVTFSMDDAKRAGLAGRPNYQKYPRQMLLARASSELCRQMFPDVLGGITVFAEEAVDMDDDLTHIDTTGSTLPTEPRKEPTGTKRSRKPRAAPAATQDAPAPADDDKPTDAQRNAAMAAFDEAGYGADDERHQVTDAILGRHVNSWKDLNRSDASTIIDALQQLASGDLHLDVVDGVFRVVPAGDDIDDDPIEDDD